MRLSRLLMGLTSSILVTGAAIAQDMPALVLDASPGVPIPFSVHIWGALAVGFSWLAVLFIVGALGRRQDARVE
jgi:hypothetical protein